jgi:hypothetical protein
MFSYILTSPLKLKMEDSEILSLILLLSLNGNYSPWKPRITDQNRIISRITDWNRLLPRTWKPEITDQNWIIPKITDRNRLLPRIGLSHRIDHTKGTHSELVHANAPKDSTTVEGFHAHCGMTPQQKGLHESADRIEERGTHRKPTLRFTQKTPSELFFFLIQFLEKAPHHT